MFYQNVSHRNAFSASDAKQEFILQDDTMASNWFTKDGRHTQLNYFNHLDLFSSTVIICAESNFGRLLWFRYSVPGQCSHNKSKIATNACTSFVVCIFFKINRMSKTMALYHIWYSVKTWYDVTLYATWSHAGHYPNHIFKLVVATKLPQVMVYYYLTAPRHYLNQCSLIISKFK